MAKLSQEQIKGKLEREIKRQNALYQKKEIKEKKRIDEENVYRDKYKKLIGDAYTPKLTNLVDLDDYFPKIERQLDEDGRPLENNVNKFIEQEENRINAEKEIDKDLTDTVDVNQTGKRKKPTEPKKINEKNKKELLNIFKKYKTFVNEYIPRYNKYVCSCCGSPKNIEDFYFSGSIINAGRIDANYEPRVSICKECGKKLFESYYLAEENNKDAKQAMERFCCDLNLYWDEKVFISANINYEKNARFQHITQEYMRELSVEHLNYLTYWDSPVVRGGEKGKKESKSKVNHTAEEISGDFVEKESILYKWDKEDAENRKTVVKMVGYDPFDFETDENKKILYKDLLNILDLGMENDLVKLQAAIQIVQSFFRIRQMDKEYVAMKKKMEENKDNKNTSGEKITLKDLKDLSDLKAKEMKAITDFAKDNGFSERYAVAKAKGENTLSGIMNKMGNANYEKAIVNMYDIETSESIQQAAEASIKAIFSQLSIGETDVWKTCQEQLNALIDIRKERDKLKEQVRLLKIEVNKEKLIEKARESGIEVEEEDNE